jgi:hypothetical protein
MLKKILKVISNNNKKQIIKNISYGKFLRDNPKATKEERRKAIKRFLDNTR